MIRIGEYNKGKESWVRKSHLGTGTAHRSCRFGELFFMTGQFLREDGRLTLFASTLRLTVSAPIQGEAESGDHNGQHGCDLAHHRLTPFR
ncbi:hypothetical protein CHM34_14155 [Paludifilum halophilum]|uniref:Uncharacterized protein n=1 Tax=Paludifilum halophilum TaxID=1642702 RepID=A0A235B433_9BACL|nr:hypothetical protein CHM34_14155 [Paludifilum halophilum]